MSSVFQNKRRIGGTAAAPGGASSAADEGVIAFHFPGVAGDSTKPSLYANDGGGWRLVNPDPSINVVAKSVPGVTNPWTDGNAAAAVPGVWPWAVNAGEVPIVTHNAKAYAFTGGVGSWGTTAGGNALTAGMFTALGAAAGKPEAHDWSSRTETDLGAAYTAWSGGAGTPSFGSGTIIVKWKDGSTYLLTNPATPGAAGSYQPIASSKSDALAQTLDWTGLTGNPATLPLAYAAWAALAGTNVFDPTKTIIVKYGNPAEQYLVTAPKTPNSAASYYKLVTASKDAVDFIGTANLQAAYNPATMTPTNAGEFMLVGATGVLIDNAGSDQWPIDSAVPGTSTYKQGDMLVWDGSSFHHINQEVDLSAYLPLAGGTMTDGATITFDATTAKAGAGAASLVIIEGDGSTINGVVLDAGTY